ncbi:hypothetical protein [Halapricum desulfuricans]|uniref:Uncharacterized protein n=1 Tax=Halapricum desulfuricans TaxID=2841257 RepID=A0A897NDG3_9EURY|nr:hypothetical protein [Halapricum desulfuricans]QSG10421.1 hypothetical protein HSR122_3053 [Halapricum desulfuricans]
MTVTATLSPECRFYEPPCEVPAIPTTVFERTGTLEAGDMTVVIDEAGSSRTSG